MLVQKIPDRQNETEASELTFRFNYVKSLRSSVWGLNARLRFFFFAKTT